MCIRDSYCTDLTGKARRGELDRIVGREKEIERVVQILSRRTKNNPCLIGEPDKMCIRDRIKGLVDEVKADGNVILFIDEVHNLVGTGDAEGSMNAANIPVSYTHLRKAGSLRNGCRPR